jgi:hypothetical protein
VSPALNVADEFLRFSRLAEEARRRAEGIRVSGGPSWLANHHLRDAAELDGMAGRWREEVPVNVNTKERR